MCDQQATQRQFNLFSPKSFQLKGGRVGSNLCFPQTKTVLSLFSICVFVAKLPTHLRHVLGVASRVAGLETEGAGLETERSREVSVKQPQASVPVHHGPVSLRSHTAE